MAVKTAYSNVKVKCLVIQGGIVSLNGTVCGHLASVLDLGILRVPSFSSAGVHNIFVYIFLDWFSEVLTYSCTSTRVCAL